MRMHVMRRPRVLAILVLVGTLLALASGSVEAALTTKSPEVLEAVDRGIAYLAANGANDTRLGACALAGMSLLTYDKNIDHPMVVKCAETIQKELGNHDIGKLNQTKFDIYSTGLSFIFLVDRDKHKHRADIECLLGYLRKMQKPHGGWGYPNIKTGDTSMTQYGVFSYWKAKQAGFNVPIDSIERVTLWLVRTQDPSGGYGYQGRLGENNKLINQSEVRRSLTAAGLGSVYACSKLLGMIKKGQRHDDDIPPAMKEIKPDEKKPGPPKVNTKIDSQLVFATADRGNQWFAKNFKVDSGRYNYYFLYAFERYMSLRDRCEKTEEKNPQWYSDIAAHLLEQQAEDGSWKGDCGVVSDTAFSVLFLLRYMKGSLPPIKKFDGGLMTGHRGFPKDTKNTTLNADGQMVSLRSLKDLQRLLDEIKDNPKAANIDALRDPLPDFTKEAAETLLKNYGDILRRLMKNKSPKVRLAIVKGILGKTRNLDNVEVLIFALTDPAPEVVHAANEALLRIRRNSDAVALPPKFTEEDRRLAIEKWKDWYRSIRPDAN